LDQSYSIRRYIIKATDKRRHVGSTGFGGQKRLSSRENQSTIGTDTFIGKISERFHAVLDHRYLHHDLVVNFNQLFAFTDNPIEIGGNYLSAHVAVDQVANGFIVAHDIVLTRNAFLGHKRRVGGDSVEYP